MASELRLAVRNLLRAPGFTAIALLTLALGIGFSASSFSMANAFLLRDVPYPDAGRLVRIFATSRQGDRNAHSPGNAIDLRAQATAFSHFALYNGDLFALGEPGQPAEQVYVMQVTADFFDLIGVQPVRGRTFHPAEDQPEEPKVALLTHRAWVRRYAADDAVLGRTIRLNTELHTIVGVLPPGFEAPLVWGPVDYITPRTMHPGFASNRKDSWMQAVGRLKADVSLRQAQTELATIAARLEQAHPTENAGRGVRLVGLAQSNMDSVSRSLLWLMTGIALAMLLIACANLASLQVARAFARSREFAVRAAIGGTRWQLMRPLFAESLTLAVAGGVCGLFVASWSNAIIGGLLLIGNEPGFAIPIDGRVLLFAAFSAVLSGVAFGFAPAWLSSRSPAAEALKEGARGATTNRSHQRLKRYLIVSELAIALALVGVAAAFGFGARSFVRRTVGWNIDGLFGGYLVLPYNPYGDNARSREFYRTLLPKLSALPGVQHATLCNNLPLFALGPTLPIVVEGQPLEESERRPTAQIGSVTSGYFAALQIPLREGAVFAEELAESHPPVAVVNEAMARQFWPGSSAIGRRIRVGDGEEWIEVVGVAADVRMLGRFTALDTPFQVYRPLPQSLTRYTSVVLRTPMAPEMLTRSVQDAIASLDPDLPLATPGSLRASFERNLSNLNLVIINLGISAGMGLLIAAVGLFGVISQLTAQRTRDIGVRIALGAARTDILRLILSEGVRLLVLGVAVGIPGYYALVTVLRNAMPAMDLPGAWLLTTNLLVLGATMLLACWLPAQRATRINPADALRAE